MNYYRFYELLFTSYLHIIGHGSTLLPLRRMTSLRRRAQPSSLLQRILLRCVAADDGERRDEDESVV